MAELDTVLRELGGESSSRRHRTSRSAIRGHLGGARSGADRSRSPSRVLVVVIGAAFAVPQARTAILDWLGLDGVSVVRVDEAARQCRSTATSTSVARSPSLKRGAARRGCSFRTHADSVWVSTSLPGGKVRLLWGTPTNVRLLLTEFRGRHLRREGDRRATRRWSGSRSATRALARGPARRRVPRSRRPLPREPARLAGTRSLAEGDVTLRLEGGLTKEEALRIARTARKGSCERGRKSPPIGSSSVPSSDRTMRAIGEKGKRGGH